MLSLFKTRLVSAAALTVAAFTLGACSDAPSVKVSQPQQASPAAPPRHLCEDAAVAGCHEIRVGSRTFRYYLSAGGPSVSGDAALLVDIGGPGVSLSGILGPDYGTRLRRDLSTFAKGKSLLLIEEPWVDGAADDRCRATSASFYKTVRQSWRHSQAAEQVVMQCPWGTGVYGWNRTTYRAVVGAILAEHRIRTLDMAALSFGAVRYSYIDDVVHTAVLVRPAAAPGTLNSTVLEARAAMVWRTLTRQCADCVASGTTRARIDDVIGRYSTPMAMPERSVPLTDFDIASALVAEGIHPGSATPLAWDATVSTIDEAAAARLSDSLWLRIGEQDISPAMVAYVDEYCQAYPGTPSVGDRVDPIRTILATPVRCAGRTAAVPSRPKPVDCLIVGINDTSAPAALAATWQVRPAGTRAITRDARHWFTDLQRCAEGKS